MPDDQPGVELVAITELTPHPLNSRVGNVSMLAESIKAHGQYRSVVVNRPGKVILAGHHVVKAAKRLGRKKVSVSWVNVDELTALRILLADNRTSDRASNTDEGLSLMLRALPDLVGTGYSLADLDELEGLGGGSDGPTEGAGGEKVAVAEVAIKVGPFHFEVSHALFDIWAQRFEGLKRKAIVGTLRELLGFPLPAVPDIAPEPEGYAVEQAELVDLDSLVLWPGNPRQGDLGAVTESLREFGQYRPITAQTSSRRIIAGNHTALAAKALGWDTIAVAWHDCDDVEAAKIVLVDNRSSDVATYEQQPLADALRELDEASMHGTGWEPEDLDELLADIETGRPMVRRGVVLAKGVAVAVGPWGFRVEHQDWRSWAATLDDVDDFDRCCSEIAERLDLPRGGPLA